MLAAACVERIRFSWERKLEEALQPWLAPGGAPGPLGGETVPLTELNAPRVYKTARDVADSLGCRDPFELFQTRDFVSLNAQALLQRRPFGMRLIGPVVNLLDELALRAVLGHEVGHYLAHGPGADPLSFILWDNDLPRGHALKRFSRVAAELTADRFALLACRDIRAAVRLEVVSETCIAAEALGIDEMKYLDDVCKHVEAGEVALHDGTHPSREFRLYAARLFSGSDVYRELTEQSAGGRSLRAIDAVLVEALKGEELMASLESNEDQAQDSSPLPAMPSPSPTAVRADDVEARFRKLEDRAAQNLERRFEELERREREKS